MVKHKYFIDAYDYGQALDKAIEMNLTPQEFVYVPRSDNRRYSILGFHNIPKENLIGNFSDEEEFYLTR